MSKAINWSFRKYKMQIHICISCVVMGIQTLIHDLTYCMSYKSRLYDGHTNLCYLNLMQYHFVLMKYRYIQVISLLYFNAFQSEANTSYLRIVNTYQMIN